MKKPKTPMQCKTYNDLLEMPRDNVDSGGFWIITDGAEITIAEQNVGEPSKSMTSIPKATFDKFVKWYVTGRMNGKVKP